MWWATLASMLRWVRPNLEYCKTPNFREHLIFVQIREGVGQGSKGMHRQVKMAITSLIMVRFSKSKNWLAA